jgi:PAS domain S-box-containing protein
MNDTPVLAESIVEHISDAVIFADCSETIARWNRGAEALFGYSANEALGRKLDLIIPEHLRGAHSTGFGAAIANGTTRLHGRPTLTRATHKSGRKLYVEMTFAVVKASDGTALGSAAVARDVTERIEQERATRPVSSDIERDSGAHG